MENLLGVMGCMGIVLVAFPAILLLGAWLYGAACIIDLHQYGYLLVMIPDLIATIVVGGKIVSESTRTPWGAFWRVALVNTCAGMVGGIVYIANDMHPWKYFDYWVWVETVGLGMLLALWFSVFPAFVIAWIISRRKKKEGN